MMRRYLASWPDEVPRIFRMLDLVDRGADGHRCIYSSPLLLKLGLLGMGE